MIIQLNKANVKKYMESLMHVSNTCWSEVGWHPWTENNYLKDRPKKWEYSFAKIADNKIISFIIVAEPDKQIGPEPQDQSPILYVYILAVLPEYRNKSVALEICKTLTKKAKEAGYHEIRASVKKTNQASYSLILKLGGKIIGDRLNDDQEEMYIMSLIL